jgi:hypothetical protein
VWWSVPDKLPHFKPHDKTNSSRTILADDQSRRGAFSPDG